MYGERIKENLRVVCKHSAVQSLLINFVCLVVILLMEVPQYTFDTDVMMQAQLFNISGTWPTGMVLFSNVYLGRFLKVLCGMPGHFNWYTIFQYAIIYLALWKIGNQFLRTNKSRISHVMYFIFNVFVGYECYINISYMKTAALLCISAMYMVYGLVRGLYQKKKWLQYIYAGCGMVLGGLISWKAALISGSMCLVGIVLFLLINRQVIERHQKRNALMTIIVAIVLVGVLQIADYRAYDELEQWSGVNRYRNTIEQVEMFGVPHYTSEIGDKTGLTKDQYSILTEGHYITLDGSAFERLKQVKNINHSVSGQRILNFMRTVPISLFRVGMFYGNIVLWLLLIFSHKGRKKLCLLMTGIITGVAYLVMYFVASCNTSIVHFLLLLPAMLLALMNVEDMCVSAEERRSVVAFLLLGSLLLYHNLGSGMVTSVKHGDMEKKLTEEVTELEQPWHAICLNEYLKSYSAFERYDEGLIAGKNLVVLDGAYTLIPLYGGLIYPAGWNVDQPIDNVNIGDDFMIWMHVM